MKKIKTFAQIIFILCLAYLTVSAYSAEDVQKKTVIQKGPYLQNVKTDAITIMWETNAPGASIVEYDEMETYSKIVKDDKEVTIHEVTLTGLEIEKTYYYKVTTGNASARGKFRTSPRRDTPFKFAVWGDNRTDVLSHTAVAQAIAKAKPDIAINVGDVVTNGEKYEQWGAEYFIPIGVFARNVPTFIAIGNHEKNAHWYYDFVSQPGNEAWYSFDYGNAHFTIYDSNQDYTPGSEQYKWLKKDLASPEAQNAAWRFVFKHHPEYSEGWDKPGYTGEPMMQHFLKPLYEKNKVDIVFAGHTHDYERGFLKGVYYIITGGGGSSLDTFQQDFPHITVYKSEYEFCLVEINGNKLNFSVIKPNGELIDSFEIQK
ncbi:MAG: metallophosphoesterase family protein [bacterium]